MARHGHPTAGKWLREDANGFLIPATEWGQTLYQELQCLLAMSEREIAPPAQVIDWIEAELMKDDDSFRDIPVILADARQRFGTTQ